MRLYLALKVPPLDLSDKRFQKLKSNLEQSKVGERWISLDQLYIPLLQLGDLGQGTFLNYYQILKSVIEEVPPLELKLSGVWGFPSQKEADMLWINVQNSKHLRYIQEECSKALDLDEDRLIRPHLPLVYLDKHKDVSDLISPFKNFNFGSVKIDEIKFVEKLPTPLGVRMLGSYILEGPKNGASVSI